MKAPPMLNAVWTRRTTGQRGHRREIPSPVATATTPDHGELEAEREQAAR